MKIWFTVRCAFAACAGCVLGLLLGCGVSNNPTKTAPGSTPKFLYASNCEGSPNGSISGFTVDPVAGTLTALTGTPVVVGLNCPAVMTVDPAQRLLFVPDDGDDVIHVYSIGTTGTLSEITGSPYDQCAYQLAVDPSGKFLIAPDDCNGNVAVYSIGASGTLTAVIGSPFFGNSMTFPVGVAIDSNGRWVYVTDEVKNSAINVFALSSSGTLAEIAGSPFVDGSEAYAISVTPNGKYLYSNDYSVQSGQILAFSINSNTGGLTSLATPGFAGGACWDSVDANGAVLFSTDCQGNLFSSTINSDGSLTPATGSPIATGGSAYPVAGDPSGRFVYAANDGDPGQMYSYSYSAAGQLSAIVGSPFASGSSASGIVVTH